MELKHLKHGDIVKLVHPRVKVEDNPWVGTIGEFITESILPIKRPAIVMKITHINSKITDKYILERIGEIKEFPIDKDGWAIELINNDWDT